MQAVIEELNLTADPEFNAALQGPSLKVRIGGAIRDRLPAAFAARLVAGGILPSAHAPPPSPDVVMANVVAAVTNEIGIIIDGKTLLMGVNFSSEQADIASAFVNSLITRYMAGKVNERAVADRKANADLEKRAEQVHGEIDQLEQKIQDTRQKYEPRADARRQHRAAATRGHVAALIGQVPNSGNWRRITSAPRYWCAQVAQGSTIQMHWVRASSAACGIRR